jgi:hypothetical protein
MASADSVLKLAKTNPFSRTAVADVLDHVGGDEVQAQHVLDLALGQGITHGEAIGNFLMINGKVSPGVARISQVEVGTRDVERLAAELKELAER